MGFEIMMGPFVTGLRSRPVRRVEDGFLVELSETDADEAVVLGLIFDGRPLFLFFPTSKSSATGAFSATGATSGTTTGAAMRAETGAATVASIPSRGAVAAVGGVADG